MAFVRLYYLKPSPDTRKIDAYHAVWTVSWTHENIDAKVSYGI